MTGTLSTANLVHDPSITCTHTRARTTRAVGTNTYTGRGDTRRTRELPVRMPSTTRSSTSTPTRGIVRMPSTTTSSTQTPTQGIPHPH